MALSLAAIFSGALLVGVSISLLHPTAGVLVALGLAALLLVCGRERIFIRSSQSDEACALIDGRLGLKERLAALREILPAHGDEDAEKREILTKQLLPHLTMITAETIVPTLLSAREKKIGVGIIPTLLLAVLLLFAFRDPLPVPNTEAARQLVELLRSEPYLPKPVKEELLKLTNSANDTAASRETVIEALERAEAAVSSAQRELESKGKSVAGKTTAGEGRKVEPFASPPSPTPTPRPPERSPAPNQAKQPSGTPPPADGSSSQGQGENQKKGAPASGESASAEQKSESPQKKGSGSGGESKGQDSTQKQGQGDEGQGKGDEKSKQESSSGEGQDGKQGGGQGSSSGSEGGQSGDKDSSSKSQEKRAGEQGKDGDSKEQGKGKGEGKEGESAKGAEGAGEQKAGNGSAEAKEGGEQGSTGGQQQSPESKALAHAEKKLDELKKELKKPGAEKEKGGKKSSEKAGGGGKGATGKQDLRPKDTSQKGDNRSATEKAGGGASGSGSGREPGNNERQPSSQAQDKGPAGAALGEKDIKRRGFEDDGGKDGTGGLKGEKGYRDIEVQDQPEQVDTRFTGKEGTIARNDRDAKLKRELSAITLEKPEPNLANGEQPIPPEYRELLR